MHSRDRELSSARRRSANHSITTPSRIGERPAEPRNGEDQVSGDPPGSEDDGERTSGEHQRCEKPGKDNVECRSRNQAPGNNHPATAHPDQIADEQNRYGSREAPNREATDVGEGQDAEYSNEEQHECRVASAAPC